MSGEKEHNVVVDSRVWGTYVLRARGEAGG